MSRALFYLAGGISLATAVLVTVLTMRLAEPNPAPLKSPLDSFSSRTTAEIEAFRSEVRKLDRELGQSRSTVSSVATERTPTPGLNAFNSRFVAAVRAADARREQQLRPVERQLGVLSQQLIDLQQRATSMDIRMQDAVRELGARITELNKGKDTSQPTEAIVAIVGSICSLATLALAVRKETRDSRETELKIRELEHHLNRLTASDVSRQPT